MQRARLSAAVLRSVMVALAILAISTRVGFSITIDVSTVGVSATSVSFGSVIVDTTSPTHTLTMDNKGSAALTISSVAISGTYASRFAQTNDCSSVLAPGASCTISLTFTPNTTGLRFATLNIKTDISSDSKSVSLSGTGIAGATVVSAVSPGSLSFGSLSVGSTSGAQTSTLSNTGTEALTISSLSISGADPGDFAQTNTCGSSLAAGGSCTISVTFKPTASGTRTASINVSDNSTGSPQTVSVSGTGTAPAAGVSPSSISYGNEAVGSTSGAQTVTLSNTGNGTLTISSLSITGTNPGDFAQTNTCASSVAAGGSCTISVTFTPAATGSLTATVSIANNASGSPQTVSLSGTGTAAGVTLSPTSLSFGTEPIASTSSTQTVTLANGGSSALSISSLTITGTDAGDFAEVADTCGTSVAAGANCTIGVTFTPSLASSESASVTIADNASGSPQTVSLSGTGVLNVSLSWTASSSSGIVGYNVYRGTTSGGESSTPLNSSPITGTSYIDESVTAGTTYYYVVTAVGSDDTQSADSGETSASVP